MMTFQMNKIASFLFKFMYGLARILIILFAIYLIALIVTHGFNQHGISLARKAKARTTVQTLMVALDRYKNDVGHYPLTNDSVSSPTKLPALKVYLMPWMICLYRIRTGMVLIIPRQKNTFT